MPDVIPLKIENIRKQLGGVFSEDFVAEKKFIYPILEIIEILNDRQQAIRNTLLNNMRSDCHS